MDIKSIEKIKNVEKYINKINFYTRDEAKRCRLLLARVLRELDKLNNK
jgi:hypothetical protein